MLNDLLVLERGLVAAGFSVAPRHPDVQSPGRAAALHVRLGDNGSPGELALLPGERVCALWTFRDGKQNSFPYVQMKRPLLSVPSNCNWHSNWSKKWKKMAPLGEQRMELNAAARDFPVTEAAWSTWPGQGLRDSLSERLAILSKGGDDTQAVTALIERFLEAVDEPGSFIGKLTERILDCLTDADADLIALLRVALVGKAKEGGKAKDKDTVVGAPLYFDVARHEFADDIASGTQEGRISAALAGSAVTRNNTICDLTGEPRPLHVGNFPQPSVPVLGQIYVFSKNSDIPAAPRYGRSDDQAIGVDAVLVQRLGGALEALTAKCLEGRTWRSVPSEKPKKSDLFLAFVEGAPEAPMADMVVEDDYESDLADGDSPALDKAAFMVRTERVVEAVKAKVGDDFRKTPVSFCILRKVDKGNAKTILHRTSTIEELYVAAVAWARAQDNLPEWLTLPVPTKSKSVKERGAPRIAPLQLPRLTRMLFTRGGRQRAKKEPIGITSQDAFSLFLSDTGVNEVAHGALRLVLRRQGELVSGTAQARRKDAGKLKLDILLDFDRIAALGSAAAIGVSLSKIGRPKEVYMNDTAFKLGQLLAVADVVHVGYCMDMRGGDVPPTLLGNSVLTTAQSDPVRALAVLCRRWKPYGAWAKRPSSWTEADRMKESSDAGRKQRGWAMLTALSQAHRADDLAQELHNRLPPRADDPFRAELLLGYVAGLPRREKSAAGDKDTKRKADERLS